MGACDGVFEDADIPFEEEYQDYAVSYAYSTFGTDLPYAKWLIQCWFDMTFGGWNENRFDVKNSRVKMAQYIRATKYASFEELLEDRTWKANPKRIKEPT